MPLWGTILTVVFSGIVAVVAIIVVIRSTLKDGIDRLEKQFDKRFDSVDAELKNLSQRIDRHLEGHS